MAGTQPCYRNGELICQTKGWVCRNLRGDGNLQQTVKRAEAQDWSVQSGGVAKSYLDYQLSRAVSSGRTCSIRPGLEIAQDPCPTAADSGLEVRWTDQKQDHLARRCSDAYKIKVRYYLPTCRCAIFRQLTWSFRLADQFHLFEWCEKKSPCQTGSFQHPWGHRRTVARKHAKRHRVDFLGDGEREELLGPISSRTPLEHWLLGWPSWSVSSGFLCPLWPPA